LTLKSTSGIIFLSLMKATKKQKEKQMMNQNQIRLTPLTGSYHYLNNDTSTPRFEYMDKMGGRYMVELTSLLLGDSPDKVREARKWTETQLGHTWRKIELADKQPTIARMGAYPPALTLETR
jgi:hypothetical protein